MHCSGCAADGRRGTGERGATVVEFLGVAILAITMLLAVIQLALFVWARNVAFSAAHEGARLASEAGQPIAAGAQRTRLLLHDGLGRSGAAFVVDAVEDGDHVVVVARGPAPAIVPFLPHFTIAARAAAFDEDRVFG